jgi:thymidylate kinase
VVRRSDSVVVEFFGLPGAGKSSLAHRVAQLLAADGRAVHEPSRALAHGLGRPQRVLRKALRVAREAIAHPRSSARALRAIAATRQRRRGDLVRVGFNWLLVTALARAARTRSGVHLLDQGLVQGAWSIALDGDSDRALALLESSRTAELLPDRVVIVAASPAALRQRLSARPGSLSRLERGGGDALFARGEQIAARIVAWLGDFATVTAINETPADLEQRAAELAALLRPTPRATA